MSDKAEGKLNAVVRRRSKSSPNCKSTGSVPGEPGGQWDTL